MDTVYVSEAEALVDLADLMKKVRAGSEVVIEGSDAADPIRMIRADDSSDPEYDAWVSAKVQESIDDSRPRVSQEAAQARFLAYRQAALLRRGAVDL